MALHALGGENGDSAGRFKDPLVLQFTGPGVRNVLPFPEDPSIGLASNHLTVPLVVPLKDWCMGLSELCRFAPLVVPAISPKGWPQRGGASGV